MSNASVADDAGKLSSVPQVTTTSTWHSLFFSAFCNCTTEDVETRSYEPNMTSPDIDERALNTRQAARKASRKKSEPKTNTDENDKSLHRKFSGSEISDACSEYQEDDLVVTSGRRRSAVDDFMAVRRAGKAFAKAVSKGDGPDASALDRGVHVENIYDFYDPETRKVRIRKMDERVVHQRRSVFLRGPGSPASEARSALNAFMEAEAASAQSNGSSKEFEEASDAGSDYSFDDTSPRSSGSASSSGGKREEARRSLRKPDVVVDAEATANWGHLIGKVLHRKVLDFQSVKDKAIRKRRFAGEVSATDAGRSGTPVWLGRLQERAKAVAAQAFELAKKCARESTDLMDHEWEEQNLLTTLFSTEYLDTLMLLTNAACKLCASQPALVAASAPCRVFGDLHGQLRDLLLFFNAFGMPGRDDLNCTYVFNGDFVDRGQHQVEVIGLLLSLKVMMPEKVWLIRGNHEDRLMNEKYGFKSECLRLLGRKMFDCMQNLFDRLPIACLVSNRVLVVHGGIGDGLWKLSDIWGVARPLTSEKILAAENSWLFNILWSDPIEDGANTDPNVFGVHASPRGGVTAQFAWNITKTFCARNGLGLVIRSHQSKKGSRGFDVMHSKMLVRVFSARDYEGHGNDSAVLYITQKDATELAQEYAFEGSLPADDMLIVRPQVLRSVEKQRAEAERHAIDPNATGGNQRRRSIRKSTAA